MADTVNLDQNESSHGKVSGEGSMPVDGEEVSPPAYVDESIVSDKDFTEDELRQYRARANWEDRLKAEVTPGECVTMPDPYRSLALDLFGNGSIIDDLNKVVVEEAYERLLEESQDSAAAVAASRIAQLKNISQLSRGYSSLVNAILALAQSLEIERDIVSYDKHLNRHEYKKAVEMGDAVDVNDLRHICALILAKARWALELRSSLEKTIAERDSKLNEREVTIAQMREDNSKLRAAPKSIQIDSFPYVLYGKFSAKTENGFTQVEKYVSLGEDGIYKLSTAFKKAKRFSSPDKAGKCLLKLLSKPDDNLVVEPEKLSIMAINLMPVGLSDNLSQQLAPYKKA